MFKVKNLLSRASKLNKSVVYPEAAFSDRVLKAVEIVLKKKVAKPILLGDPEVILNKGYNLKGATIIDPKTSELTQDFSNKLYEMRKAKGMTIEQATDLVTNNPFYFAAMMVQCDYADGTLGGAETSTADSLRPGLQIIKAKKGISTISSCTMFVGTHKLGFGENNTIFFTDTSLNIDPTSEQISDIVMATVDTAKLLAQITPRVSLLSFSSYGSGGDHPSILKMKEALEITKKKDKKLLIDGELQLDASIIESVGKLKAPKSQVAGRANVLVFPDLNSANIGYKIAERFGRLQAVGQIQQGFNKPVNDLSRGCNAQDIVMLTAVTVLQTQIK